MTWGLPWWSSGEGSVLLLQGAQAQSMVGEQTPRIPRGIAKFFLICQLYVFFYFVFLQLNTHQSKVPTRISKDTNISIVLTKENTAGRR